MTASLDIEGTTVTFTDATSRTYTAENVAPFQAGDGATVCLDGSGIWLRVWRQRTGKAEQYPLRDAAGFHATDLCTFPIPSNPFLPSESPT